MREHFETDHIKLDGLEKFIKAVKLSTKPIARVGILGDKVNRKKDEKNGKKAPPTNSEIGAAHEYGSPKRGLPQRSFLRVPIADKMPEELEKGGFLTEQEARNVIKQGTIVPWLRQIASKAEEISKMAFSTKGYGKWQAWKKGYTSATGDMLVDTTQLRDSITHDVKE